MQIRSIIKQRSNSQRVNLTNAPAHAVNLSISPCHSSPCLYVPHCYPENHPLRMTAGFRSVPLFSGAVPLASSRSYNNHHVLPPFSFIPVPHYFNPMPLSQSKTQFCKPCPQKIKSPSLPYSLPPIESRLHPLGCSAPCRILLAAEEAVLLLLLLLVVVVVVPLLRFR